MEVPLQTLLQCVQPLEGVGCQRDYKGARVKIDKDILADMYRDLRKDKRNLEIANQLKPYLIGNVIDSR